MRVSAESGQPEVRQLEHGRDGLDRVVGRHAEPLEPDVDLDEHVARAVGCLGIGPRAFDVDESGREPVGQGHLRGLRERVRVHEDRRRDTPEAQSDALAEVRDGQRIGPMREEDLADLGRAVTVSVRFDDGEDLPRRSHKAPDGADVRGGGVEVDEERGRPRQDVGRVTSLSGRVHIAPREAQRAREPSGFA